MSSVVGGTEVSVRVGRTGLLLVAVPVDTVVGGGSDGIPFGVVVVGVTAPVDTVVVVVGGGGGGSSCEHATAATDNTAPTTTTTACV
ncbi:hypothetical protein [Mycobacterium sp. NPDC050041]|uniref:hypothetical protein n=1 Tax=Mycobacterium sp. NPDC050041 TaxID=3364293 RepID=UPI003C2B0FFF